MDAPLTLPSGEKLPPWALWAIGGGALLIVLITGKSGKTQYSTGENMFNTEVAQRLQAERQAREDWEKAQSTQWEAFLTELQDLLETNPYYGEPLPPDPITNPPRPPAPPITPPPPGDDNRPPGSGGPVATPISWITGSFYSDLINALGGQFYPPRGLKLDPSKQSYSKISKGLV